MSDIQIKWYDRAEDVFLAYWSKCDDGAGLTLDELLEDDQRVVATTMESGEDVDVSAATMLAGIEMMGCWGFVDIKDKRIHAWAAPMTDPLRVMEMLGHELGHLTGQPDADDLREERRADQYGSVAAQAYRLLMLQPVKGVMH